MQIKFHGYGIKGWYGVKWYAARMQAVSDTALRRARILDFWGRHGLAAAMEASGASRRTLYSWQSAYRQAQGRAHALNEGSRAPRRVLSDNGSEFKAGFTQTVLNDGALRWLACPRCPRMNAHAERFDRTIQEGFVEFHKDLLLDDTDALNDKLPDYLIGFNGERPYHALKLLSPMQFLEQQHQCNMYWRDTMLLQARPQMRQSGQ